MTSDLKPVFTEERALNAIQAIRIIDKTSRMRLSYLCAKWLKVELKTRDN